MKTLKSDMKTIQGVINNAYMTSGRVMALLDGHSDADSAITEALDKMSAQFENSAVTLRNLCEKHHKNIHSKGSKPRLPHIDIAGSLEITEYGWLHIELNTLLPHCRFQAPAYLTDTITRLLDDYEHLGNKLPFFDDALLVIDEHCNIKSRVIFDSDNKGWKAVPNALKGRVIKDDDQFSLGFILMSTKSDKPACHIYLLPRHEAGDFFFYGHGSYPCHF